MCVHRKNIRSYNFSVSTGVHQRGIISHFVCVYMDDLHNKLNKLNTGCIIGSMLIRHLTYADDLMFMAHSSTDIITCICMFRI